MSTRLPVKRLSDEMYKTYMKKPKREEWWPEGMMWRGDVPGADKDAKAEGSDQPRGEEKEPSTEQVAEKKKVDSSKPTGGYNSEQAAVEEKTAVVQEEKMDTSDIEGATSDNVKVKDTDEKEENKDQRLIPNSITANLS